MTIATFTTTMGNQEGVDNLNGAFDKDIGHAHDGTEMGGGLIDINSIKQSNMTKAIHSPAPVNITSTLGVLTLTEASNSFIANGTENITAFAGWTQGTAVVRWNTVRTLVYNAGTLVLQGLADRVTSVGDVGVYEIVAGVAREIGYFPVIMKSFGSGGGEILQLKIVNNVAAPNSKMDITANNVPMYNDEWSSKNSGVISLTADLGASGVNGLDTGTKSNSTGHYLWVISKEDGTIASLWSLSATTPTMPTGYIYKRRVGWNRTDGSGNIYRILQVSNKAQYIVTSATNTANMPIMASGSSGNITTPTYTALSCSSFIPTTSISIQIVAASSGASSFLIASNNSYGANRSITNPAIYNNDSSAGVSIKTDIVLESNNIYYAMQSGAIACSGWEDNI